MSLVLFLLTYLLLVLLGLVKKKKGASFLPSHIYAVCYFYISLPLTIKVKLFRLAIVKVLPKTKTGAD